MINGLLNKTVAILGLGKTGIAVARELRIRGVHVICWDENEKARNEALKLNFNVKDLNNEDFSKIELLVMSPGIPHTYPQPHPIAQIAKDHNVKIVSDIELFVSTYKDAKYIGITGTNGKSTTTALIYHILKENNIPCAIGGNFGIPVFDLPALNNNGYYVLEMSSYQIDISPSIDFDISILLNITPDHLSRHNGMDGYVSVKKRIFNRNTKKTGTNIVAVNDIYTKKIFKEISKEQSNFKNISVSNISNLNCDYCVNSKGILINCKNKKEIFDLSTLDNLQGKHNWQNIVSVFAAIKSIGLSDKAILKSIQSFKTLHHRIEKIGNLLGVSFINDSKATNAESVKYAINSMKDIYWIIGGRQKEGGIRSLESEIISGNIKRIFTIGECEKDFYNFTKNLVSSYRCHKLDKAVVKAFKYALKDLKKGIVKKPVILLSPATASFDQYKSFEARGEHFEKIYNMLVQKYNKF